MLAQSSRVSTARPRHNSHGRTLERRARQALMVRRWQPWKRSTGPRTEAGKQAVSRNLGICRGDNALRMIADIVQMAGAFRRRVMRRVRMIEGLAREKNALLKLLAVESGEQKQVLIGQWLLLDRRERSILRQQGWLLGAPAHARPCDQPLSFAVPCVMKNP